MVTAARGIRADLSIDPKLPLEGRISRPVDFRAVQRLAGVALEVGEVPKTGAVRSTPEFDLVIDVPHGQMEAQRKRLEKERDQLIKNIANSQRQLSNEVFLSKAPGQVFSRRCGPSCAEYEAQLRKIEDS